MASWGFVVVLMCSNETLRAMVVRVMVVRLELDKSHLQYMCGTRLTNNVCELQAMCYAVLWLIEQKRIDDSMRLEIR